ncbi:MAG: phage terminase small subunit P27 family [Candidatus Humimicrobiia bacterium]
MASPKPKPTALKILEGNPGKRPLNENEPKPIPIDLKCPDWLLAEAKEEWKRLAPELERLGLLTKIDKVSFEAYCQSYAKWKKAEKFLKKHGMTIKIPQKDEYGNVVSIQVKKFPEVSIANECLKQIRSFASEFGLTPSSRGRLFLPGETPEDEMEKLLSKINS